MCGGWRPHRRDGLRDIATPALWYAAQRLFLKEGRSDLTLDSAVLWPWTVFGCTFEVALPQLTAGGTPWLELDDQGMHCRISMEALQHVALF